jgi:type VI secretion system protein
MDLMLRVTHGQSLVGKDDAVIVDTDVFSIGRGVDNSWTLPDPKLHISNKHCVIHRKNNEYHLTDISTNGVYINGSDEPLGRGRTVVLKNSDVIDIGEFKVAIDLKPSLEQDLGGVVGVEDVISSSAAYKHQEIVDTAVKSALAHEIGKVSDGENSATDIDELLGRPSVGEKDFISAPSMNDLLNNISPEKEYFSPPVVIPPYQKNNELPQSVSEDAKASIPDNWLDLTENQSASKSIGVSDIEEFTSEELKTDSDGRAIDSDKEDSRSEVAPLVSNIALAAASSEDEDLFYTMLEEAGIEPRLLAGHDKSVLAKRCGHMLNKFAQGTVDTLATRSLVKGEFRLQQTVIRPKDNNPFKFSPTGGDALRIMMLTDSAAYMSAEASIEESFKDIQAHQLGMMMGIQAAFSHLLARFDPDVLSQKFEDRPRYNKGILGMQKVDYWREYQDFYHDVCEMMEEEFQNLFSSEFGKAYEEQLRKLR